MSVTTVQVQDKPRNHERGSDDKVDQRRIAWLCADYGFSPSKASRLVRRYHREFTERGWTDMDALFVDWLVTESIVEKYRIREAYSRLTHSDPTGETAARRADAAGAAERLRALQAARAKRRVA